MKKQTPNDGARSIKKRDDEEFAPVVFLDLRRINRLDKEEIAPLDRIIYSALILRPNHIEFPQEYPRTEHCSQEEFARMIGVDPAKVSRMVKRHILTPALPWRIWAVQFLAYQLGVQAGRRGSGYY